jgi:hypothetical protein
VTAIDMTQQPVSIKFQFMKPRVTGRRLIDQRRELRWDEFRQWGFSSTRQKLQLFLIHWAFDSTSFGTTFAATTYNESWQRLLS